MCVVIRGADRRCQAALQRRFNASHASSITCKPGDERAQTHRFLSRLFLRTFLNARVLGDPAAVSDAPSLPRGRLVGLSVPCDGVRGTRI